MEINQLMGQVMGTMKNIDRLIGESEGCVNSLDTAAGITNHNYAKNLLLQMESVIQPEPKVRFRLPLNILLSFQQLQNYYERLLIALAEILIINTSHSPDDKILSIEILTKMQAVIYSPMQYDKNPNLKNLQQQYTKLFNKQKESLQAKFKHPSSFSTKHSIAESLSPGVLFPRPAGSEEINPQPTPAIASDSSCN